MSCDYANVPGVLKLDVMVVMITQLYYLALQEEIPVALYFSAYLYFIYFMRMFAKACFHWQQKKVKIKMLTFLSDLHAYCAFQENRFMRKSSASLARQLT